jgi:hypothetical protein
MAFRICIVFNALLVAAVFACAGAASPACAQVNETVLWTFSGGIDGAEPTSGVIADGRGGFTERLS